MKNEKKEKIIAIIILIYMAITSVIGNIFIVSKIIKSINKNMLNCVYAETATEQGQEIRIINPYIQYMSNNWWTQSITLQYSSNSTQQENNPLFTMINEYNNEIYKSLIKQIRLTTNAGNTNDEIFFEVTIQKGTTINNVTNWNTFTYIEIAYTQENENGNITVTTGGYWNTVKQIWGISEMSQITELIWITQETYITKLQEIPEQQQHYFTQFIQRNTTRITTPQISINFNTISWQPIQNATYYNIYRNGTLIAQTQTTQWVTIENGNYQVQAGTNIDGYSNSELSNTITQNTYNDIIGNGANFYTLFGAIIDSEIYLIKALTNYTIWGINFFNLFKLFITFSLIVIIIKFALKQKG